MKKPAVVRYLIHELIETRWSPVTFADRPVEREKLGSLMEAARWAASCYNEQPWRFIVASKDAPKDYERALACLVELNQAWARTAPVLMVAVASLRFERDGSENGWARHDVGMAVMSLLLQATALGLHAHAMAGFDKDAARAAFAIPDGFEPMTAIAVGYLGDPAKAPEALRKRDEAPRSRKPLESFVYAGRWGRVAPFIGDKR